MRFTASILVLLALFLSPAAFAQGVQYGSISGTVSDSAGQPLPGVTVTAASPSLQGKRTSVSDAGGQFRLNLLPVGTYSVSLELSGFQPKTLANVSVSLGTTTAVESALALATVSESIVVSAAQIVVDTTKSTVDTSISSELADTLPTARDYVDLMELAPGVEPGFYAPLSGGQSNTSNLFLVDGVDTTDPRVQIWRTMINWDAIAETQIQTAGFSAEYGRAPGAVLNLVTKSGGNEYHGTGRVVASRESWSSKPGIEDETGRAKASGAQNEETRPSFTLGGPLLRDQLWFFGTYEKRDQSTAYSRYASISDALGGVLTQERTSLTGYYASMKLTWQVNPKHQVIGFYNADPIEQSPAQAYINGAIFSRETERDQTMGGENVSLQWTGILTDRLFVEAKYQDHSNEVTVSPASPTFNSVPYTYDLTWGYAFGGPSIDYSSVRNRSGILASGTYSLDAGSRGLHEIKGGIEYLDIAPKTSSVWNTAGQYWTLRGAPYIRFLYLDQSGFGESQQDYWAAYVQDRWQAGNLTLNLGVRAEATAIHNNVGTEIVSFDFTDQIAPRLGFAYDLKGDSIYGSVSRYYHLATNYIGDAFNATTDHVQRWQWKGTCDATAAAYYEHPNDCWRLVYDVPVDAGGAIIDPDLKPSFVDEVSLGYSMRINDRFAASADLLWRWQNDQIDWYDPKASGTYLITNVPKAGDVGDKKWSEYQGISVSLQKLLGPEGLQFLASYTYALKTDAWGVTWRDIGQFTFSNPELVDPLRYGRTQSPHRVKFHGSYTMPWRTTLGIGAFWSSGNVYTATKPGVYGSVFTEERGSSRVGNNWEADLYLEQAIPFRTIELGLYANVFNAFNNQQVTGRAGNSSLATFRNPTAWQSPRRLELGVKATF